MSPLLHRLQNSSVRLIRNIEHSNLYSAVPRAFLGYFETAWSCELNCKVVQNICCSSAKPRIAWLVISIMGALGSVTHLHF